MHSPPVQPSSSETSGTGSVITMWLEVTVRRRRREGSPASAAPAASTTDPARTRPPGVSSTKPLPSRRGRPARVPSKIGTPLSSSADRKPKASLAG